MMSTLWETELNLPAWGVVGIIDLLLTRVLSFWRRGSGFCFWLDLHTPETIYCSPKPPTAADVRMRTLFASSRPTIGAWSCQVVVIILTPRPGELCSQACTRMVNSALDWLEKSLGPSEPRPGQLRMQFDA